MSITLADIPKKFYPSILGHQNCQAPQNLRGQIDQLFSQGNFRDLKKGYIREAGNWIFKGPRGDGLATTPDTHLYRVRKAEKIRTYIANKNLGNHFIVPQKWLYWAKNEQTFYVVGERVNLANEVVTPANDTTEHSFKLAGGLGRLGGQCEALANGSPKRPLSPIQAKALAELSILGYTDLSYNNIFFTQDGKVAILDTEPQKRALKKAMYGSALGRFLGSKDATVAQQAMAGMAKLKLYCSDPAALRAVEKVETVHVLWNITKCVARVAVAVFVIYHASAIVALLKTGAFVTGLLKKTIIVVAAIKVFNGVSHTATFGLVWWMSGKGLDGVIQIANIEQQGAF